MKSLFTTTAAALILSTGIAAADTIGDPSVFGLVEAGNAQATVDLSGAAGFTGNPGRPAPAAQRHSEIGDLALFGLVEAGNNVAVDIGGAVGFTADHGSATSGMTRDPASGLDRTFR